MSDEPPQRQGLLRRQRRHAAAIPLGVRLAVLDRGRVDSDLQRTLLRLRAPTRLLAGKEHTG